MATQQYPFYIVDAFTKRRRRGNPAAVVLLSPAKDQQLPTEPEMQSLAAEFNLSETAFVWLPSAAIESGDDSKATAALAPMRLRWFTPACEVALCGHATLAAATAVHQHLRGSVLAGQRIEFDTLSGRLTVARNSETNEWSLDLPLGSVEPISLGERDVTPALLTAILGADIVENFNSTIIGLAHSPDRQKLLIELGPSLADQFLGMRPDAAALMAAAPTGSHIRGVIVTMSGEGYRRDEGDAEEGGEVRYDFLSRYFAPWVGIPEDPVTGAAHTVLAVYWRNRLGGRDNLLAKQCSRRGGVLGLKVDVERGRVALIGHSTVSAKGFVVL